MGMEEKRRLTDGDQVFEEVFQRSNQGGMWERVEGGPKSNFVTGESL